jgi:RNA polymerase sigma factor (TIGR02999 family)
MSEVSQILERVEQGDARAAEDLLPILYDELRRVAAAKMAREPPGQTLQATALVHEAWMRLAGDGQTKWQNRAHFLAAAAEAMRRILVENARRKVRIKRGGGQEPLELLESAIAAPAEDEKMLQVHEALASLEVEDSERARIVKLRFFVGLKNEEIASLLGVNEKTVRRHWEIAKVNLFEKIKAEK